MWVGNPPHASQAFSSLQLHSINMQNTPRLVQWIDSIKVGLCNELPSHHFSSHHHILQCSVWSLFIKSIISLRVVTGHTVFPSASVRGCCVSAETQTCHSIYYTTVLLLYLYIYFYCVFEPSFQTLTS